MSFFLEAAKFMVPDGNEFYNPAVELIKILLLYNELEPLFLLTAHPAMRLDPPKAGLPAWWSFPFDGLFEEEGWAEVMRCALMSYICLNMSYLFPRSSDPSIPDYRATSAYQKMLIRCTAQRSFDSHTIPHREFFGVERGRFYGLYWNNRVEHGRTSLSSLTRPEYANVYCPTAEDVEVVQGYLAKKGLPLELRIEILSLADYKMKRRLIVPDDPLHPKNSLELRKYLNYCWHLLIRVNLIAEALGTRIAWNAEITQCIWDLYGENLRKMVSHDPSYVWQAIYEDTMYLESPTIGFV
jgi:hypothetical protein